MWASCCWIFARQDGDSVALFVLCEEWREQSVAQGFGFASKCGDAQDTNSVLCSARCRSGQAGCHAYLHSGVRPPLLRPLRRQGRLSAPCARHPRDTCPAVEYTYVQHARSSDV